ncbi:hypothetical protein D5R81_03260 [Parashewanella spongiae]|uniref:Uncharacterized protein n=1 Tax=Parashewanella spongiae TaxID=342950 RepID=A0A3A6U0B1_9GAMM|nr:hypothetical protein [Parashewanella spongiae]MCL1077826.1 hypothetical protein [Parashewanella spongiae]RJY18875.1 hypothetical protein D5R81_03260 [Parashewanella spongiae]
MLPVPTSLPWKAYPGMNCTAEDASAESEPAREKLLKHTGSYGATEQASPTVTIKVTAPTSKTRVVASRLIDFNHLQIPLPELNKNLLEEIESEKNEAIDQAKKESEEAKQAGIQLAKKNFFIKLVGSIIALGALALAIGLAVPTGGASIAVAGILGVVFVLSVSDTFCSFIDWRQKVNGKEGLPMEGDFIGNLVFGALRCSKLSDKKKTTIARWVSVVTTLGLSVGLLWTESISPKKFLKPSTVIENGGKLVDKATGKLTKYADFLNASEVKLREEESEADIANREAKIRTQGFADIFKLNELRGEANQVLSEKLESRTLEARKQQRAKAQEFAKVKMFNQQLETAVSELPKQYQSFISEFDELKKASEIKAVSKQPTATLSPFTPSKVKLEPANDEIADNILKTSQTAVETAKKSIEDLKQYEIRAAKRVFIGKCLKGFFSLLGIGGAIAVTTLSGGTGGLLLVLMTGNSVLAFSDAIAAYQEWQNKVHGRPELPLKTDGAGNAFYRLLSKTSMSEANSLKWAKRLSTGLHLLLSAGSAFPKTGEVGKGIEEAKKLLNPLCEGIAKEQKEHENEELEDVKLQSDLALLSRDLASEQVYDLQIVQGFSRTRETYIRKCNELRMRRIALELNKYKSEIAKANRFKENALALLSQLPPDVSATIDKLKAQTQKMAKRVA